jgi:predicted dinucleotide-utilizing enzyme
VNYLSGAVYVYGERKQSRHEAMVGWKKPSQQIKERMTKINAIIDGAAKKAIRKLGL